MELNLTEILIIKCKDMTELAIDQIIVTKCRYIVKFVFYIKFIVFNFVKTNPLFRFCIFNIFMHFILS
jgi:hypothetical protein